MAPALARLKIGEDGIFSLDSEMTIGSAAMHLAKNRLTFAMVREEGKTGVVGMLGEAEILRFVAEAGDLTKSSVLLGGAGAASSPIRKWMTPVDAMPSIRLDDSLETALSMIQTRIWRHLPVLDHWGRLHSILDLRDVVTEALIEDGLDGMSEGVWKRKTVLDVLSAKRRSKLSAKADSGTAGWQEQLEGYLSQNASTHLISSRASVEAAAKQLRDERLIFLVVQEPPTDAEGRKLREQKVAGLLTERSFLHYASYWGDFEKTMDPTTCEPLDAKSSRAAGDAVQGGTVHSIMTPLESILNVSLADPVSKPIDIFFSKNARHLPVIDKGKLSGIISIRDLLRPYLGKSK